MRARLLVGLSLILFGSAAVARKGSSPSKRAMGELSGKFKWGMSPDDCVKIIATDISAKYAEKMKLELDVFKQDQLRKDEKEEIENVRKSLVKFNGTKTGWDTSIIEREFSHNEDESMLVMWERDQRRFLFFHDDRLYKQYIALNSEHPAFAGKTFGDFAKLMQDRYGRAEMKLHSMRTRDDVTLDHLEWAPSGEYTLWAIDQSNFYGNFCLKLMQTNTVASMEKKHMERFRNAGAHHSLVDAVTGPQQIKGDPHEGVVDDIVGKKTK